MIAITQDGPTFTMLDLTTLVFLSLSTSGLAAFMRALPWPANWLKHKPLACPMCMSGWSGFIVIGYAHGMEFIRWELCDLPLLWLALVGIAAPVFKQLYPPDIELPLP